MVTEEDLKKLSLGLSKKAIQVFCENSKISIPDDVKTKVARLRHIHSEHEETFQRLSQVPDLLKGVKKRLLRIKVTELGIDFDPRENISTLAVRLLLSRGPEPFETLKAIGRMERSRAYHNYRIRAGKSITLEDFDSFRSTLEEDVQNELSTRQWRAILERSEHSPEENVVYTQIGYEHSSRVVREIGRGLSIKTHTDKPLARATAVVHLDTGEVEISCRSASRREKLAQCFSRALVGEDEGFQATEGDLREIPERLTEPETIEGMHEEDTRMNQITLADVGLPGNPNRVTIVGEDLFQTLNHFADREISLLELGQVEMVELTFQDDVSVIYYPREGKTVYSGSPSPKRRTELRQWLVKGGWMA